MKIKQKIQNLKDSDHRKLKVTSVDNFQGQLKSIYIIILAAMIYHH